MLEFKKVCDALEELSMEERGRLLAEKSRVVFCRMQELSASATGAKEALAGFIIGSAVAEDEINEREYLLIYPTLMKIFGDNFRFTPIKEAFRRNKGGRKKVAEYVEEMLRLFSLTDEAFKWDVITLCLCVILINGGATLKAKRYIRRLCV